MPSPSDATGRDVRMRGFERRSTVEQAWEWIDAQTHPLPSEVAPLADCAGRVLACEIVSPVDVPGFDRAMMDGFALHAVDTLGATTYQPLELTIIGESWPGRGLARRIELGEAARIMTGAPLPEGTDAVLPAESATLRNATLQVLEEIPSGKHLGRRGEDVRAGSIVFQVGRRLRPQDLGVASSIGLAQLSVVRRPRVGLVITGNELLPSGSTPHGYSVTDANGPMLAALVERDGGIVHFPGLTPDDPESIHRAMLAEVDVLLVSGGSSVGLEDHAPVVLAQHGTLALHGVAMRPSSPTGMGRLGDRIVFLLPGNPVSCLAAYDFFAGRAIRRLAARSTAWPYRCQRLPLLRKLSSVVGRVDYARVHVHQDGVEPLAIGGASVLTSTTRAEGFVVVPADSEGFPAGSLVDVYLYDS